MQSYRSDKTEVSLLVINTPFLSLPISYIYKSIYIPIIHYILILHIVVARLTYRFFVYFSLFVTRTSGKLPLRAEYIIEAFFVAGKGRYKIKCLCFLPGEWYGWVWRSMFEVVISYALPFSCMRYPISISHYSSYLIPS